MKLALTLTPDFAEALINSAVQANLDPSIHATRIIEDFLMNQPDMVSEDARRDAILARSLIDRAVQKALEIVETQGFRRSITFDTIQAVSAIPDWINDYRLLVRDDPYKTGNPRKHSINQNLGYYIKRELGATSALNAVGKPENIKVKGSIIQSYTPLASQQPG